MVVVLQTGSNRLKGKRIVISSGWEKKTWSF